RMQRGPAARGGAGPSRERARRARRGRERPLHGPRRGVACGPLHRRQPRRQRDAKRGRRGLRPREHPVSDAHGFTLAEILVATLVAGRVGRECWTEAPSTATCKQVRVIVRYRPVSGGGGPDQERRVDLVTVFVPRTWGRGVTPSVKGLGDERGIAVILAPVGLLTVSARAPVVLSAGGLEYG